MKKTLLIIGAIAVAMYIIISFIKGTWDPRKWFASAPPIDNSTTPSTVNPPELVGIVDLWCENGKYYKRTTTAVYGSPDMLELTKAEFDALVAQGGISYSGSC